MKKLIILIFLSLASFGLLAQSFWGGKTMPPTQVKAKWGNEKFDSIKFKAAPFELKSKMAYSIMIDKTLKGKSVEYIRETFGSPDGFYFIDSYPAYIIQMGKNHSEETWQIVFKLNNKFEVRDIIVHKNCCEK